ncbi:MAG TPA: NAD(P)-dependent alcohol dehydrogenase [Phenylobacterium sp.]|uniref:zinc-dependent alcohol dehydrogenase family protein n=1 Tax=Phenylobacterium sp. TaxID=1871053 RepID=UPI002B4652E6|nr:NAD(P)-dependent alcohol dehydrogenase [Phenylobacterium sp.]HKR89618.1 NAD(P)-dependent alcohol dehydrogenase [Phenylobacterium sp.]
MLEGGKVVRLAEQEGPARYLIARESNVTPRAGEVLVRVHASSLNFHDYAVVTGMLGPRPGVTPMSDGAGVVEAVGDGVTEFASGDLVMSLFFPEWRDGPVGGANRRVMPGDLGDGFAAEWVTRPAHWFTRIPKGYTLTEAASLPCAALTAWRALIVEARVKPGDWVVTQGTGGVSLFAVQFAKAAGARTIASSSSEAKLERLKQLGVDHVINYRSTPDWARVVREASSGGADVVVEIGGAGTLNQSIRAVRPGGCIVLIGTLAGLHGDVATRDIMANNLRLQGITVGSRAHQLDMIRAIEANGVRPIMDRHFPLEGLADAFVYQASGAHFGKVMVDIAGPRR